MSAWANVQAPKAARLNDIMVDQEYLTSDLSLAELISFEEIQGGTAEPLPAECYDEIALVVDDADFALALALQEQLFEECVLKKYAKVDFKIKIFFNVSVIGSVLRSPFLRTMEIFGLQAGIIMWF